MMILTYRNRPHRIHDRNNLHSPSRLLRPLPHPTQTEHLPNISPTFLTRGPSLPRLHHHRNQLDQPEIQRVTRAFRNEPSGHGISHRLGCSLATSRGGNGARHKASGCPEKMLVRQQTLYLKLWRICHSLHGGRVGENLGMTTTCFVRRGMPICGNL